MHACACVCVLYMHVCVCAPSCLCRCLRGVLCMFTFVQIPVCVHEYLCRGQRFLSAVCFNHCSLDMYEAESLTESRAHQFH